LADIPTGECQIKEINKANLLTPSIPAPPLLLRLEWLLEQRMGHDVLWQPRFQLFRRTAQSFAFEKWSQAI
jgi:hypothetical protein